MAGPALARRLADAGDEAGRRGRAGNAVRHGRIRTPSPRRGPLERSGDRQPRRNKQRRHEFRRRAVRRSPGPETIAEAIEAEASGASADEARMVSATCDGVRVVSVYAPNGRALGTPFYEAKLAWFERLARWLRESCDPAEPLVVGGDFNVAPEDADVYDMADFAGATATSRNRNEPPSAAAAGMGPGRRLSACTTRKPGKFSRGGTTAPGTSTRAGYAHRPPLRDPARGRALRRRRDRPRGSQGEAALGPRPGLRRPRRLSKRERTVGGPGGAGRLGGPRRAPRAWSRRGASSRRRSRMDRAWPAA